MSNEEWGKMVMPGVYMIPRGPLLSSEVVESDEYYLSHPDLIHHDIQELEGLVAKLRSSNQEIEDYLSDLNREKSEGPRMLSVDERACDDDDMFLEAIVENKRIIGEKEIELRRLRNLIVLQSCGKKLNEEKCCSITEAAVVYSKSEEIESPIHFKL